MNPTLSPAARFSEARRRNRDHGWRVLNPPLPIEDLSRGLEHFQAKRIRFAGEDARGPIKRADSVATESARVASPLFFENATSPEILLRALTGPNL